MHGRSRSGLAATLPADMAATGQRAVPGPEHYAYQTRDPQPDEDRTFEEDEFDDDCARSESTNENFKVGLPILSTTQDYQLIDTANFPVADIPNIIRTPLHCTAPHICVRPKICKFYHLKWDSPQQSHYLQFIVPHN